MKHIFMFALCILLSAGMTACTTTEAPPEESGNASPNQAGYPGNDTNNTNEAITDNENDATADVQDEDANDLYNEDDFEYTEEGLISPADAEKTIKETSDQVINLVKNKDMEALAKFIHPEQGVRFTLYSFVNKDEDVVFDKEKIKKFFQDESKYVWGYFDGSGDVVELTPADFYAEFIYNHDYANAEQIGYNTTLSGGNTLNNQFEVYENPIIVEYYFPGFDPQYEGLDWQSLSLVFEQEDSSWYLVGIIHNRHTV